MRHREATERYRTWRHWTSLNGAANQHGFRGKVVTKQARALGKSINPNCILWVREAFRLCYKSFSGLTGILQSPDLFGTRMDNGKHAFDVDLENAFNFLSPEYATLFNSSAATAFQHPIWLEGLYSQLVPKVGAKPLIVVVRDRASGTLAMVLPLLRVRRGPIRTVEFADLRVSDYLAPVCTAEVFSALLQDDDACRQLRRLIGPFDLLRMSKLPDGRIPIENLLTAPRRVAMETNAYSTVLFAPFDQGRANALDRSYQRELAKKFRQLQKKGALSFACCEDGASIAEAM